MTIPNSPSASSNPDQNPGQYPGQYPNRNQNQAYPVDENPGRTLGIVALVLSFPFNVIGAVIGIIALNRSKRAGFPNKPALAAIIIGFVLFVVTIIGVIVIVGSIAGLANELAQQCEGLSGQQITISGQTVTCP